MSRERLLALLPPVAGALLFAVALFVLRRELAEFRLGDVRAHVASIGLGQRVAAAVLTALGYLALTGYDALGFRWIGRALAYPRIALASFVGFVFSHNLGLSAIGGNAVRYRILSSFGIEPGEIARVIAMNAITFWVGFLALVGSVLVFDPLALPSQLRLPFVTSRPIGFALLALFAAYAAATVVRRAPIRVAGFELALPRPPWLAAQTALSMLDWALAAAVFWVLLPKAPGLSFAIVLGAFGLAQVVGLVSHVPAGLGVFEGVAVLLLAPYLSAEVVLGSAIAYRLIYYVTPLVVAVLLFGGYELAQRRHWLDRSRDVAARLLPEVVPRAFSAATAIAGLVLLLSGATPAARGRTSMLEHLVPLPIIEVSHLIGSLTGVALLLLARALQQRIDAAYYLSLAALAVGAVASLSKGLDWEEATLLAATFAALLPCRRFFYRQSSLVRESFSPEWSVGIALALAGTLAVTLFAYRHLEYSNALWWEFELNGHGPRSLRALLGAGLAVAVFAALRLLRPAPPDVPLPTHAELDALAPLVATSPAAEAHLVLLGDKAVLRHESGRGFLMYGAAGRTWVAMGDPIGPPDVRRELAWRFREIADEHGAKVAFYEVAASELPVYLDLGLVLRKLGEEARIPLAEFTLEGKKHAKLRQARSRMLREGCRFEVIPAAEVAPHLDALAAVSESWLAHKNTREKRFSLGCFDRDYLARMPIATIRRGDAIVAFANLWASGERNELSVDLMRYGPDAPPAAMDALFGELLGWGREQGFAWFSLGMAPLSGFEHHRLAPLWNRLGALLFRHGEHFYNFQGLREFKEKFDPVWEPRYLAAPGALSVPIVLTRVASLVNAGLGGTVAR